MPLWWLSVIFIVSVGGNLRAVTDVGAPVWTITGAGATYAGLARHEDTILVNSAGFQAIYATDNTLLLASPLSTPTDVPVCASAKVAADVAEENVFQGTHLMGGCASGDPAFFNHTGYQPTLDDPCIWTALNAGEVATQVWFSGAAPPNGFGLDAITAIGYFALTTGEILHASGTEGGVVIASGTIAGVGDSQVHYVQLSESPPSFQRSGTLITYGTANCHAQELITLQDRTIVIAWSDGTEVLEFVWYDWDGTVIDSLAGSGGPSGALAVADDATSFYVFFDGIVQEVQTSDASILNTYDISSVVTTGPFLALTAIVPSGCGIVPPDLPTPETVAIRRLRRSPHVSAELFNQFISSLQIDIEAGVGLSTGQGADPQLMLRLSHDGGFTWGLERLTSLGALGEYDTRAIWHRLGRARDLVVEVSCSDPVFIALFDAFIEGQRGTS